MAVDTWEWDLVVRLLAVMAPDEGGTHPGVQLSPHEAGRVWNLADGTVTMDLRRDGSIPGLREPVWMTARAVWFTAETAGEDGPFCRVKIDDRRDVDGTVAAVVAGDRIEARSTCPITTRSRPCDRQLLTRCLPRSPPR